MPHPELEQLRAENERLEERLQAVQKELDERNACASPPPVDADKGAQAPERASESASGDSKAARPELPVVRLAPEEEPEAEAADAVEGAEDTRVVLRVRGDAEGKLVHRKLTADEIKESGVQRGASTGKK